MPIDLVPPKSVLDYIITSINPDLESYISSRTILLRFQLIHLSPFLLNVTKVSSSKSLHSFSFSFLAYLHSLPNWAMGRQFVKLRY